MIYSTKAHTSLISINISFLYENQDTMIEHALQAGSKVMLCVGDFRLFP